MRLKPAQLDSSLPRLPRFGLRTLFAVITLLSVMFLLMSWLGALWSLLVVWGALLVACHVLGNAWGTQAFDLEGRDGEPDTSTWRHHQTPRAFPPHANPNRVVLRYTAAGGKPRIIASVAGAIVLGAAGGVVLSLVCWRQASPAAIVIWTLSCAVIGALAGFVGGGFLQVCNVIVESNDPDLIARRA